MTAVATLMPPTLPFCFAGLLNGRLSAILVQLSLLLAVGEVEDIVVVVAILANH